mmetsp:Transcript_38592/g.93510  ORF Transcript_38592/g.93510 Transcript_38592/m.93510 type:complete len:509 (+) Transcript_38592:71-1597(+)
MRYEKNFQITPPRRRRLYIPNYKFFLAALATFVIHGWTTQVVEIAEAFSSSHRSVPSQQHQVPTNKKKKKKTKNKTQRILNESNGKSQLDDAVVKSESLHVKLQKSYTIDAILENVTPGLTLGDRDPNLPSLTLVRLSKQMITQSNQLQYNDEDDDSDCIVDYLDRIDDIRHIVDCLAMSDWSVSPNAVESAVNGVKATAVISRLIFAGEPKNTSHDDTKIMLWEPLVEKFEQVSAKIVDMLQPHHLSGLAWSIDCFNLVHRIVKEESEISLPSLIQSKYDDLDLPFRIIPGAIQASTTISQQGKRAQSRYLSVDTFIDQVDFEVETIRTESNQWVAERRQTAWQGDPHVGPFLYSGKAMARRTWSVAVEYVRDELLKMSNHYYDCCLLNLYPDGGSAMRYHIDPDQGELWDFETAVVSIGATRRFAFRSISIDQPAVKGRKNDIDNSHAFVVMAGDITEMVRDCQLRYQHTVKPADDKKEKSPRVSLVFKKSLRKQQVLEQQDPSQP